MLESTFIIAANKAINYIADSIIEQDRDGIIDVNFTDDGVLYLDVNGKQFVINAHTAAMQIWMVSPISGPHHCTYIDNQWLNRNKQELMLLLQTELNTLLNFCINL